MPVPTVGHRLPEIIATQHKHHDFVPASQPANSRDNRHVVRPPSGASTNTALAGKVSIKYFFRYLLQNH